MIKTHLTRRSFIATGAAGGLMLSFHMPSAMAQVSANPELNCWVLIQPDDQVVIRIARSEMGQGTRLRQSSAGEGPYGQWNQRLESRILRNL